MARTAALTPVGLLLSLVAALAPAGLAAPAQAAAADPVAVTVSRTTSVTEGGNSVSQATIGETITYTVTATIPADTTLSGAVVTDVLGSRQALVPGSLCVSGCSLDGTPYGNVSESPANTVRVPLPATYTTPAGTDGVLVLTFQAKVLDVAANHRGQALGNTATFVHTDVDGQPQSRSGSTSTTIVEPSITTTLTNAGSAVVTAGETKAFTVTASNSSSANVSTAHGLVVVDTVPGGTEPVTINDSGVWNAASRTITWSLPSLAPGASKAFTYTVQVDSPAIGGTTYANTVVATVSSLPTATGGVRTPSSSASTAGDYDAIAQRVLTVVLPGITQSVDTAMATIGTDLTWTIGVTVPADVRYFDATVVETVPDGLAATGYGTITCTAGCPGTDQAATTFPFTTSGTSQQAAWFLGDLAPAAQQRSYQLVLRGHVLDAKRGGGVVAAPVSYTSGARVRTNRADLLPAAPVAVPSSYADSVGPAAATTAVREPVLTIDKSVDKGPQVEGNDLVTYSVAVSNTSAWPAHDVVVTDLPDQELVDVTLIDGADLSTDSWAADDPDMRWLIPGPLAAGATRTLTYTARVAPSATMQTGDQVGNTAAVPSYAGASSPERAASPANPWRSYAGPQDAVTLTVAKPSLSIVATPDGGPATAGEKTTVDITVTNTDPVATAHGVVVRGALPEGLTYSSSSPEGTSAGQAVEWTPGTLAPGASRTLTLVAQVGSDVPDGSTLTTVVTTSSDELPAGTSDSGSVTVGTGADVSVVAQASVPTVVPGTEVTYAFTTTNGGPSDSRGTTLTSTLPSYLSLVDLDDTTSCSAAGRVVTCTYGALGPAATRELEMTARVAPSHTAPVVLTADVATTTPDSVPANNRAEVTTAVTPVADLGVTMDASPTSVVAGDDLVHTITTTNEGPSDARAVMLTDVLPDDLTFVSLDDPERCSVALRTVTCAYGDLAPGAVRHLEVTARVASTTASPVTNAVDVASSTHDPDLTDNTSARTTSVTGVFATGPTASIVGVPVVGGTLSARTGTTAPAADSFTYTWAADGRAIDQTLHDVLHLTPAEVGKTITVTVTAHRDGYVDSAHTSPLTAPVAKGSFGTGPTATVNGTVQVGQTLTAGSGVTAPVAETYRYTWLAGGEPVAGATGSTLLLEPAQRGKAISVLVVATRTGYLDASSRSAPTTPVVTDRAPSVELHIEVPKDGQGAALTPNGEPTAVRGRPIVITWSSDPGSRLAANDALAAVLADALGGGPLPASGRARVRLDRSGTHTFRLAATNELASTTAVASLVVVRAPARLGVDAPAHGRAGKKIRIEVSGLGARERYYVTVTTGGARTRIGHGRASTAGEVDRRIRIPASLAGRAEVRLHVAGRSTLRTGSADVRLR